MKQRNWQALSAALAALLLVIGYDAVSYAANGDSLILGAVNKAGHTTTIERTTKGPALQLDTKAGSPPLAVTSGKRVAKLNADKVDGYDAAKLASKVKTFVNTDTTTTSFDRLWGVSVSPGVYRVEVNGAFSPALATSPTSIACSLESVLTAGHSGGRLEMSTTAPFVGGRASVSGSKVIRIDADRTYYLYCILDTGDFTLAATQPLTVQFTKVTSMTQTPMGEWAP